MWLENLEEIEEMESGEFSSGDDDNSDVIEANFVARICSTKILDRKLKIEWMQLKIVSTRLWEVKLNED